MSAAQKHVQRTQPWFKGSGGFAVREGPCNVSYANHHFQNENKGEPVGKHLRVRFTPSLAFSTCAVRGEKQIGCHQAAWVLIGGSCQILDLRIVHFERNVGTQ